MRLKRLSSFVRTDEVRILLLALAVRCCSVAWGFDRVPPTADGAFYHVVAERIAQGLGYTWLWPDGAVTYAAHYPVGYPVLMAPLYGLFGPVPGYVMMINALLGAGAVAAVVRLTRVAAISVGFGARATSVARWIGILLALSPTLVGYTPALMTEGGVAAFVVFAATCAVAGSSRSGRTRLIWWTFTVLCLGCATYLRPQSILFSPVLGWLAATGNFKRRAVTAVWITAGTFICILPWTLRNCDKMERCVFVSANGGWNLLIGTFSEGRGAWVALEGARVPDPCRDVFQEAAKDACFQRAGLERIHDEPVQWLQLIPDKLRATVETTAAAAEHLYLAGALDEREKQVLQITEFIGQRLAFLLALMGSYSLASRERWASSRRTRRFLHLVVLAGAIGFAGWSALVGWSATCALALSSKRTWTNVTLGLGCSSVLLTLLVHAVFFGAGRYSLPLLLWTAPLSGLGLAALMEAVREFCARHSGAPGATVDRDFDTLREGGR